jgi:hypothetical protein
MHLLTKCFIYTAIQTQPYVRSHKHVSQYEIGNFDKNVRPYITVSTSIIFDFKYMIMIIVMVMIVVLTKMVMVIIYQRNVVNVLKYLTTTK